MKIFFIWTIVMALRISGNTQGHEKWFAVLQFPDGFNDQVVLHLTPKSTTETLLLDFPLKNIGVIWEHAPFYGVRTSKHLLTNDTLSFTIDEMRIHFEGKINSTHTEIKGEFVLAGKPYAVNFSRNENISLMMNNPKYMEPIPGLSKKGLAPDPEMKRPIATSTSLFTEELTWLEVRDALKDGKTTIIIGTGGIEQNGAYLATGKHNYVLRGVVDSLARKLGDALIAPIVQFVPGGGHIPASGHMKYSGTISLTESTYKLLLKEIALSYKVHGFRTVIFLGDSGGNQWGMYMAARELNALWRNENCSVIYIHEYYDNYRVAQWLKRQGVNEVDAGVHDSFQYTSQVMTLDTTHVRMKERIANGDFSVNGVDLLPANKTIEIGKKLISYQVEICLEAIKKRQNH